MTPQETGVILTAIFGTLALVFACLAVQNLRHRVTRDDGRVYAVTAGVFAFVAAAIFYI